MSLAPLRLAAAEYVLDAASSEDLRRVADEALTRGIYSYSLGELGTTTNPTYWVVRPLFQAAMKELGIALPSVQDAHNQLVTYHLRRLTEGTATAIDVVGEVRRVADPWANPDPRDGYSAEDRDRIDRLVGCYYRYDYVVDLSGADYMDADSANAARGALDQEIRQIAVEWVTAHGRGHIHSSWLAWNDGAVRKMAQAVRDAQRFADLLLLADALEEAGCTDVELLEHCREQAPHVSDCWVIHLLLAGA